MPAKPLTILLVMLAGWINRQQQSVVDYLMEENKVLREKLGKKRILLNNDQRRRLAIRGRQLGRRLLGDICCIFSPDTEEVSIDVGEYSKALTHPVELRSRPVMIARTPCSQCGTPRPAKAGTR